MKISHHNTKLHDNTTVYPILFVSIVSLKAWPVQVWSVNNALVSFIDLSEGAEVYVNSAEKVVRFTNWVTTAQC